MGKKNFSRKKISTFGLEKERDYFIENLSMLIVGGVSITEAIESIKEGVKSERMKKIIDYIKEDIDEGLPVWKSISKTGLFPGHIISLIRLGEESGTIDKSLKTAVIQQDKSRLFRSKIVSAMMYPLFVLSLTFFLGIGLSWFILPRLAVTFSQMNIDLPLITSLLISVGNVLGNYGQYIIPSAVIIIILKIFFLFFFHKTKHIGQTMLFYFPISGRLIREIEIARFGYLLGTLLDAGFPIKKAILSLKEATGTYQYRRFYKHIYDCIEEGNSLKKSFLSYKNISNLVPPPVQELIFTGEKSGALTKTLLKISEKFEEKTDNTAKNLTVILEPVMLVIVGLGVGLVAIGVILPIYSLVGDLGGGGGVGGQEIIPSSNLQQEEEEVVVLREDGRIRALPVDESYLPAYEKPSFESEIVLEIMPGEEIIHSGKEDGWYKIPFSKDEFFWVFHEHVEIIGDEN